MNELTTPELLKAIHKFRLNVSHDQLKYWRRNNLLPKPHIRGKGRGLGIEQLWDEVCIENVRLILESSKGKRINLANAGRYLFAHNKPVGEILLCRYLSEIPREMVDNEKQRTKRASDNPELAELTQFLTPVKVSEAIRQTQTDSLMDLYNNINSINSAIGEKLVWIYNCHQVFDVLVDTDFLDLTGTSLSEDARYRRQRSILAWAVLIHHYGKTLNNMTTQAIQQLVIKCMSNSAMQPIIWPKN
ncbi:hypothetical protein SAMN06296273_2717 [Nitrosomonas ureae]|uniref:Uncharacterized protein n=1 Tax=Nitrosomonas ureae TaxID=44577 RepID=A0A285C125_9PROT|nr:hypothetical protein [Nitrosomonas ureae]SNX61264.1 hypothetical protein SAMN06296273_2717 [Nitrosomonas ureae]